MSCRRCGGCCKDVYFRIQAGGDSAKWWDLHNVDYQKAEIDGVYVIRVPSVCYWYDPAEKACRHYEDRPDICKRYLCDAAKGELQSQP